MNHAKTILPALLGLLVLFWTGDKIGYRIRADMEAGVSGLDMADRFWLDLLDPSHISTHPTDMLCGLTLVAVAGLAWAYRRAARLTLRNGEEHGSAHWAGPRDIKPFIDPDPAHNLRFTRTERLSTDTRRTLRNLNVLLLGSSGSGKTRYYVKPNLLGADMNWAVTDPKGELKRDTESPMKARGYAVHALDLVDLTRSDRFNPMRYIDPAEPQSAILRLTDNLVTNATGDRKNGGGFWEDAEKALLSALIAWVHYTEDEPTLNHVTDMLDQMGASEQDEEREFIVDALFAETRVEIAAMRAHEDDYDEQTRDMLEGLAFACAQYNTFLKGAGETKKSIIITTGVHLAPLQVREVRRILSGDDIHLEALDEGKRVVYLEPARHQRDVRLPGQRVLPMPLRDSGQESRPRGWWPARPRCALPARRVRQHRQNPELRETRRHHPLARHQLLDHPANRLPRQKPIQRRLGNHRRQLRQLALPRRQRSLHHQNHQRPARRPNHRRHRNQRNQRRERLLEPQRPQER